jgi:hypothetical protein
MLIASEKSKRAKKPFIPSVNGLNDMIAKNFTEQEL